MAEAKRSYHSEARSYQAGLTRGRMLKAARAILGNRGYYAMTIEAVAERAEVATPTVYAAFGSKGGILAALLEQAWHPPDYPSLLRRVQATADPAAGLRLLAAMMRRIHESQSSMLDEFGGADMIVPKWAELERQREEERRQALQPIIVWLQQSQALRRGRRAERPLDILWSLTGRDLYRMLVRECKWDPQAYDLWLGETLVTSLLKTGAP